MHYDLGDARTFTYDVFNDAGVPAAAASVTLTLTKPDGTTLTPAVSVISTGKYEAALVTFDQAGTWLGRWTTTGIVTADTFQFDVQPATRYIVSLDEVKEHLRLTGVANDDRLIRALDAVTTMLARKGYAVTASATEDYPAPSGGVLVLRRHPVTAVTSVTVYASGTATAYTLFDPAIAPVLDAYTVSTAGLIELSAGARWPSGTTVRVVYTAGYSDDADVKWAALEQIRLWWEPTTARHPDLGDEPYDEFVRAAPNAGLHPWIAQMLPPRPSGFA